MASRSDWEVLESRPRRVKARVISSRVIKQSWLESNKSNTRRRRRELRLGERRWNDLLLVMDLMDLVVIAVGAGTGTGAGVGDSMDGLQ